MARRTCSVDQPIRVAICSGAMPLHASRHSAARALTARIGELPTMVWDGLVAIGGFVVLLVAPIAAVTTLGYAGILLGPAAIGFLAKHWGLSNAFWVVPAILLLVPLCATVVVGRRVARIDR